MGHISIPETIIMAKEELAHWLFKFVSHVIFLELDRTLANKWINIEVRADMAERNHEINLSFFLF